MLAAYPRIHRLYTEHVRSSKRTLSSTKHGPRILDEPRESLHHAGVCLHVIYFEASLQADLRR
jgi:hypothetical protein